MGIELNFFCYWFWWITHCCGPTRFSSRLLPGLSILCTPKFCIPKWWQSEGTARSVLDTHLCACLLLPCYVELVLMDMVLEPNNAATWFRGAPAWSCPIVRGPSRAVRRRMSMLGAAVNDQAGAANQAPNWQAMKGPEAQRQRSH